MRETTLPRPNGLQSSGGKTGFLKDVRLYRVVTMRPFFEVMISSVFLLGLVNCGRQGRDSGQGTSDRETGSPTHLFLKTKVDLTLKSSLLPVLYEAMNSYSAGMDQLRAISSGLNDEITKENQDKFESRAGPPTHNQRKHIPDRDQVEELYRGVSNSLSRIKLDRARLQAHYRDISQIESNQYQIAQDFISNLDSLCMVGVGIDPNSPDLPKIAPLMSLVPGFDMYMPLGATGQFENIFQAPPKSFQDAGEYAGRGSLLLFINSLQYAAKMWIASSGTASWAKLD